MIEKIYHSKSSAKLALLLLAVVMSALSAGCAPALIGAARGESPEFFVREDAAARAAEIFRRQFGASARVIAVEITADDFSVKMPSSKNPEYADSYRLVGDRFVGVGPAMLDETERVFALSMFDFAKIDFTPVARLGAQIQKSAPLPDGKMQKIYIKRRLNAPGADRRREEIRWSIEYGNAYESVTALADASGKLFYVDQSRTARARQFVLDQAQTELANERLRATIGEKTAVAQITIRLAQIEIGIPETGAAGGVDVYRYDASGLAPDPRFSPGKTPAERLFALDEVDLGDYSRLYSAALKEVATPAAHVQDATVQKVKMTDGGKYKTVWNFTVYHEYGINGAFSNVYFDMDGNLIEAVERS